MNGEYITVNPNRTVSLSEFSCCFKPLHLLIYYYY